MLPVILNERCALFQGDSKDLGLVLGPNTVDAIVTDPPSGISFMSKGWDTDKGGRDKWVAWLTELLVPAYNALKPGGYGLFWAIPRTSHWTAYALEDVGFEIRNRVSHLYLSGFPKSRDLARDFDMHMCTMPGRHYDKNMPKGARGKPGDHRCPAHPDRDKYQGRRTALKEALEDWWLVRKPLEGTGVKNLIQYNTGGLNIDACRIGDTGGTRSLGSEPNYKNDVYGAGMGGLPIDPDAKLGRWPAHLIVDEGVAIDGIDDPALYFYCPKPSRSEKDLGLDHLPIVQAHEVTGREEGSAGAENPRAGKTSNGRNSHPTPKPVALMEWLVKLITPPGGLVLDVFAGSGTTGVAALRQGCEFVGVEMGGDKGEYIPIIRGRLEHELRTLGVTT